MEYADMEQVQLTRVVRIDKKIVKKTYVFNLERLDSVNDEDLKLYPGDTIFIDGSAWTTTRDVLVVVGTAAVVVVAITQVIWVSKAFD